jgi:hypothetical protein
VSAAAIHHEPAKYGMTGAGLGMYGIRSDLYDGADGYVIDAPALIPRGSVLGREHTGFAGAPAYHYLSHTEARA